MGLFSSKRKITVAAASTPLITREVDLLGESLMRSILRKQDIASTLVEDVINAGGRDIVRAYNYAQSDYYYGLPNGTTETLNYAESDLIFAISNTIGEPVSEIINVLQDNGNPAIEANEYLDDVRDRNLVTGELTNLPSSLTTTLDQQWQAWLNARQAELASEKASIESEYPKTVVTQAPHIDDEGNNCTRRVEDVITISAQTFEHSSTTNKTAVDDIDYIVNTNVYPTGYTFTYNTRRNYVFDGTLTYALSTERTVTLIYGNGTNDVTYSEPVIDTWQTERFPRSESSNYSSQETVSLFNDYDFRDLKYYVQFKTNSGLLRSWTYDTKSNDYPALNYQNLSSLDSPFYPIVPIRHNNVDYCHEDHWSTDRYTTSKKLLKIVGMDIQALREAINENPDIDQIDHAFFMFGVQLQDESQSAKRYLFHFFDHLGSLAPNINQRSIRITEGGMDMRLAWDTIDTRIYTGRIGTKGKANSTTNTDANQIVFRLQFDEDSYKEVTITNLRHTNYVYEGKAVETNLAETLDEDEFNFIVPLHAGVVQDLPAVVRNELYFDAMQMVFYSYEVTKVKWYQRNFFKNLLKIVAIAVAIISLGTMANEAFILYNAALAGGATALAALNTAAQVIILDLLKGMVVSHAFKLIVSQVDPEIALILSAALVTVGISKGIQAGDLLKNSSADILLKLATGINQGIQLHLADAMQELNREVDTFSKDADEKMDALEEINKEFTLTGIIDPMEFIMSEPIINFNESPDSYFYRTVHSGNVGAMAYEAITKYHDLMLELPKPQHAYI